MSAPATRCLVGCGQAYDAIAAEPAAYAPPGEAGTGTAWQLRPAPGVASLAGGARELLAGLDPAATRLFVAVDAQALNYARLELYGPARLAGFRMATLVHPTAWVAPGVQLADNVWIGPGARLATACRIDSDVLIGMGARLDAGVRVGNHGWIGPGAVLGAGVQVGSHSVIGADVLLPAGTAVGRFCSIDRPGPWQQSLPDGRFVEPGMPGMAQVIGAGYSFQKTPKSRG